MHADAFDVRLVDHGLTQGDIRRRDAGPVEAVVDDDRLGHAAGGVVDVAGQIFGATTDAIAKNRRPPVDSPGNGARVWINQQLVRVEANSLARRIAALNAIT